MTKCPNCDTEVKGAYCPSCSKRVKSVKKLAKTDSGAILNNIKVEKPRTLQVIEKVDFSGAEKNAYEQRKKPFSTFIFGPKKEDIKLMEFKKVYEPVYRATFFYEAYFDIETPFELNLNDKATEITIQGRKHGVTSKKFKLKTSQRIKCQKETTKYYDIKGVEKPEIKQLLDEKLSSFDPSKVARNNKIDFVDPKIDTRIFGEKITDQMLDRPLNYLRCISEKMTVVPEIIYYRKYRAIYKNIKTDEIKTVFFSAASGEKIPD